MPNSHGFTAVDDLKHLPIFWIQSKNMSREKLKRTNQNKAYRNSRKLQGM